MFEAKHEVEAENCWIFKIYLINLITRLAVFILTNCKIYWILRFS